VAVVHEGRYIVVEPARREVAAEERVDCVSFIGDTDSSPFLAGGSIGDSVDLRLLMVRWRGRESG
jgi:hypothetical protein